MESCPPAFIEEEKMKCQTCFYFLINLDPELWCYMFKEKVEHCKQYKKDDK